MKSSILRQTAYSYPCFLLASCHATCAVVCLPVGVFSSTNKPCASVFGTHRNKSGNPAFVPIALKRPASRALRFPPFGEWCNNRAYCGYCIENHLTHDICRLSSLCLIALITSSFFGVHIAVYTAQSYQIPLLYAVVKFALHPLCVYAIRLYTAIYFYPRCTFGHLPCSFSPLDNIEGNSRRLIHISKRNRYIRYPLPYTAV